MCNIAIITNSISNLHGCKNNEKNVHKNVGGFVLKAVKVTVQTFQWSEDAVLKLWLPSH